MERGEKMVFFVLAFLFGMGLLMILKPDLVWRLDHFFTVKGGEPTEWYLGITRVGGLFFLLLSLGLAVVFLFT